MVRRIRFVTFGCKVNQYETQVLRERARAGGYRESDGEAELIVVNTCTVTGRGGEKARRAVRRLARENPGARILVTGCYAASDRATVRTLPRVAGVYGPAEREDLLERLGPGPRGAFIERRVLGFRGHTRAFVKIQDGCPLRCSYCIIPAVRPRPASKHPDTVVREVRALVEAGHREVILTGIHLGAYGGDRPVSRGEGALAELVRRILDETDLPRLRLSSLEVHEADGPLLELLAGRPRLAPHLHLPLQSGSPRILRRMRRRYDPEEFRERVGAIRKAIPDVALSTDVIVGFPGETEEDFAATLRMMRECRFMRTHVFPFSPRPGTPAADLPRPVPGPEIRRRAAECAREGRVLARAFALGLAGRTARPLLESRRVRGFLTGLTGRYVRVFLEGPDAWMNRILPVRLEAPVAGGLRARPEPGSVPAPAAAGAAGGER